MTEPNPDGAGPANRPGDAACEGAPTASHDPLERLETLAAPVLARLTEPSHDAEHVRRVTRLAERLGRLYDADMTILRAAALLHDLGRAEPESDRPHVDLSADMAARLMAEADFPDDKREAVLHAIRAHSFSRGVPPETLEARILRDADRLDALGAIGIVRTFAYGGAFYDPDDPLARNKTAYEDDKYSVDHFFQKLFRLPEGLCTQEAKRMAEARVVHMRGFLAQLEAEIHGEA